MFMSRVVEASRAHSHPRQLDAFGLNVIAEHCYKDCKLKQYLRGNNLSGIGSKHGCPNAVLTMTCIAGFAGCERQSICSSNMLYECLLWSLLRPCKMAANGPIAVVCTGLAD